MIKKGSPNILCIGGAHFDYAMKVKGGFKPRGSNQVATITYPGGVSQNVARNLGMLGMDVGLCSMLGKGLEGRTLHRNLEQQNVDLELVQTHPHQGPPHYLAVINDIGELQVEFINDELYKTLDLAFFQSILPQAKQYDYWLIDANLPASSIEFLSTQHQAGFICAAPVSAVKADRFSADVLRNFNLWIGNRAELQKIYGYDIASVELGVIALDILYKEEKLPALSVLTLENEGALLLDHGKIDVFPIMETKIASVNGAGDGFYAGFLYAIMQGKSPKDAMCYGMALASVLLQQIGTVCEDLNASMLEDYYKHYRAIHL